MGQKGRSVGYLRHIQACNRHDPAAYLPFLVNGREVGRIRPAFGQALQAYAPLFQFNEGGVLLQPEPGEDADALSRRVATVLQELVAEGHLSHLHGEQYPVLERWGDAPLLTIDRAAAPAFGIQAFGQHLNGFVQTPEGMKMWIGRRSADRRVYPGHLDNLAAGGLPHGISLQSNLLKECAEEASIPAQLARQARAVSAITYCADSKRGFKPDTLFCYDLELPPEFIPRCSDGEVACFYLWPMEEVMERVRSGNEFKLNCNLVVIDFLIRHGFITADDPEYLALNHGLHPAMPPF